jgi:hypothetical protein
MGAPAVVPVTFTVTAAVPPSMALSATSLSFNEAQGGADPTASTVSLTNTGAGALPYTATSDSNWLSVSPASGSAPQNLQISVTGAGLLAGTYTGHITVTGGAGVLNSPQTITATFTISPVIIGDQTVESVVMFPSRGKAQAFQATALGSGTLSTMNLYLDSSNTGTNVAIGIYNDNNGHPGTLLGQVSSTQVVNGAWNTYSFPATSITAGQPYWIAVIGPPTGTLQVHVKQHALSSQFCHSETSSQSNLTTSFPTSWSSGATYSACPISAYGSLNVIPATLSVSSPALNFNEVQGGADPAAIAANLSNTGGGTMTFSAGSDSGWLTVAPANGVAPRQLQISVAGSGMQPGSYNGKVTVTAPGALNSPATLPVTFTIAPPPSLSVDQASLTFNETAGGPDPSAQTVNVSNTGGGTLNFTAQSDSGWLGVAPASGAAPQALQISVAGSTLASGTYTGNVTVTATGAQNSPTVIPVTLNVQ